MKQGAWPDPPYESSYVRALVESLRTLPRPLPEEAAGPLRVIVTDPSLDGPSAEARISWLADDLADTDETLLDLWSNVQESSPGQQRSWETVGLTLLAATTLQPLVQAFCAEIGKRLSGTATDWASRVRLRRKRGDALDADLVIEVAGAATVVELEENLPDEARLALLDLDPAAPEYQGRRLRWNPEAGAWMPAGSTDETAS
jgi:hypothetical protein